MTLLIEKTELKLIQQKAKATEILLLMISFLTFYEKNLVLPWWVTFTALTFTTWKNAFCSAQSMLWDACSVGVWLLLYTVHVWQTWNNWNNSSRTSLFHSRVESAMKGIHGQWTLLIHLSQRNVSSFTIFLIVPATILLFYCVLAVNHSPLYFYSETQALIEKYDGVIKPANVSKLSDSYSWAGAEEGV